jgi:hypothetical protein
MDISKDEIIPNININYVLDLNFSLDIYFYEANYNSYRRQKILMFGTIFMLYESFKQLCSDEQNKLLIDIENSCLNYTNEVSNEKNITIKWSNDVYLSLYNLSCNKITSNIDLKGNIKNIKFAENIIQRKINIDLIPYMNMIEIYPEKYVELLHKIELSKNVVETIKEVTMYKCGKCKHGGTRLENVYNRSIDEGTNVRVTCNKCGNSWFEG